MYLRLKAALACVLFVILASYANQVHAANTSTCGCDRFTGEVDSLGILVAYGNSAGSPAIYATATGLWDSHGVDGHAMAAGSAGLKGSNFSNGGVGVAGVGGSYGGRFEVGGTTTPPNGGIGIRATSAATSGYGGFLEASASNGVGLFSTAPFAAGQFVSTAQTGTAYGIQVFCASNNCTAIYASANAGQQTALYANGKATVTGDMTVVGYLAKAGGGWRIDHPLDPQTKYLNHGFVESDVMRNVYVGSVVLDAKGHGAITMADWFSKVNAAPVVFTNSDDGSPVRRVKTSERTWVFSGKPGVEVSWQIFGERSDAWARANQPPTVMAKPAKLVGTLMHPSVVTRETGEIAIAN